MPEKQTQLSKAFAQIRTLNDLGMPMSSDEQDILIAKAKERDSLAYHEGLARQVAFLEASLVDYSLANPKEVMTVVCRTCKEKFQTNYRFQKYCSSECLSTGVLRRGLRWDPEKPMTERWHGLPPTTIRPETLKLLLVWAREIVEQDENPDIGYDRERPELVPYVYSAALPGEPPGPPPPDVPEDEF